MKMAPVTCHLNGSQGWSGSRVDTVNVDELKRNKWERSRETKAQDNISRLRESRVISTTILQNPERAIRPSGY